MRQRAKWNVKDFWDPSPSPLPTDQSSKPGKDSLVLTQQSPTSSGKGSALACGLGASSGVFPFYWPPWGSASHQKW